MIMVNRPGPHSITVRMFEFRKAQSRRLKRRNPALAAEKQRELAVVMALVAAADAWSDDPTGEEEWSPW